MRMGEKLMSVFVNGDNGNLWRKQWKKDITQESSKNW